MVKVRRSACSVLGCQSTRDDPSVRFFYFPRNNELCLEWVSFCRSSVLRDFCESRAKRVLTQKTVCSKHFPDSCFQNELKLKLLRGVVPSLEGPVAAIASDLNSLSVTHPPPPDTPPPQSTLPSTSNVLHFDPGQSIITSTPSHLVFRIHSISPPPDVSRTSPDSYSRNGTLPLSVDVATGSDDTSGGSLQPPSPPTWSSFRQSEPPVQDVPLDAEVVRLAQVVCAAVKGGEIRDQDEAVLLLNVVSTWEELPITAKAYIYGRLRILGATSGSEHLPMVPSGTRKTEVEEGANDVDATSEISKCNVGFPSLDHLELHQTRTHRESYEQRENGSESVHENGNHTDVDRGPVLNTNEEVRKKGTKGNDSDNVKKDGRVRKHVCDSCGKHFACLSQLTTHLRVHTGEKPFPCTICDKRFSTIYSLDSHNYTHRGIKPYTCKVCHRRFARNNSLTLHMQGLHGEKPFTCEKCGKGFVHKHSLTHHMRAHTGERAFVCEVCGKTFMQNNSLILHRRLHTGEKPYQCEICGRKFTRSGDLKQHRLSHTGEKPYVCQVCNKGFSYGSSLRTHLRTHSGERPYECQECKKCFRSNCNLRVHLRTHSGEKPFACEVCDRRCRDRTKLRLHFRTHTQERPYSCEVCSKCFRSSSNLKKHSVIHSGEKPYACEVCSKCFGDSSTLRKHLRMHIRVKDHVNLMSQMQLMETGTLRK